MIDKEARRLLSERPPRNSFLIRIGVSLDNQVLLPGYGVQVRTNKNIYFTQGLYWVKYKPGETYNAKTRPFSLYLDLFIESRKFTRVAGWEDVQERAKTEPRFRWILDNTTICKELFDIAKENKYAPMAFSLKVPEYSKKIKHNYAMQYGSEPVWGVLSDPLLIAAEEERLKLITYEKQDLRRAERERRNELKRLDKKESSPSSWFNKNR